MNNECCDAATGACGGAAMLRCGMGPSAVRRADAGGAERIIRQFCTEPLGRMPPPVQFHSPYRAKSFISFKIWGQMPPHSVHIRISLRPPPASARFPGFLAARSMSDVVPRCSIPIPDLNFSALQRQPVCPLFLRRGVADPVIQADPVDEKITGSA